MMAKRLPSFSRALEVVGEIEEALQKPRLLVEPVIGQDRLPLQGPRAAEHRQRSAPTSNFAVRS